MTIGDNCQRIEKFEVWFQTPFGLVNSHETAIETCRANDWDPNLMLAPVPVAIAADGCFEIIQRT